MQTRLRTLLITLVAAVSVFALAACGSDDDSSSVSGDDFAPTTEAPADAPVGG